jgi:hypothetical protein
MADLHALDFRRYIRAALLGALAIIGNLATLPRCGPKADPMAKAMLQLDHFTDEICQCNDATCVQQVSEKMTRWGQQIVAQHPSLRQPTPAETQRLTKITERMAKCMMRAMDALSAAPATEQPPSDTAP